MARRTTIIRHLEHLKTVPRVDNFIKVDSRIASDNPTEQLAKIGVATNLLHLRQRTCDNILKEAIGLLKRKEYTTKVDTLHMPQKRMDVELPPGGYSWKVLQRILNAWKKDKTSPWHRFHQGVEPRLVEFSILGSLPGSRNQLWHKDHYGGYGTLISFGIPLIDVQDEHGPTDCIPKHLSSKYKRKPFKLRARRGELYAWDGHVTHRGTKNQSKIARPIFMFSLCFGKKIPTGKDELSLHPKLMQRL